jgi:cytochrome o ubiquinol oxidase subunit 1
MFGRLSLEAFQHGAIETQTGIGMAVISVVTVALMTYFKLWKWIWNEWFTSMDPKKIGVMYIFVILLMLFKGLVDAGMMRAQQMLAVDSSGYLTATHFQQIFSAHGVTMIFFVGMGSIFALMNLVIPLQIGARDVAFPFMNSLSFWLFAVGAAFVNLSLVIGEFSATGWLAYPPLSGIKYNPGVGVDYWIWLLQIAGASSLMSGINFLVTIFKMRCPGMTFMRMPLFTWSCICTLILVVFAFPILTVTLGLLALDRLLDMHFFTADYGGNFMMYVNLIWAWGHPEVYILVLPAFGVFSEVVATFSQKRLFGYASMVWAVIAITFLSFIVWLHHFFTMGAGANVNAFFGIMTMLIAIPTGVKIFNWLFTMNRGRIHFSTPLLWFLGFMITFTYGGMAGVLLSIPAVDFQLHNSLFLVAHFHTVIIGGVLFGFFAGFTYWFPKIFGFVLNERIGKYAFWCWFIGFFLAFTPLYVLGFMGATRRLNEYDSATGWHPLFIIAASGILFIIAGVILQNLQVLVSFIQRKKHEDTTGDPWNGRTLEWSTTSPPPFYNFAITPHVHARDPWWEMKKSQKSERIHPHYIDIHMPKNSAMGLYIAIFTFLFGFGIIWHMWWLAILGILGVIAGIIIRTWDDDVEYTITAAELAKMESEVTINS